jgi:hypothetical protein
MGLQHYTQDMSRIPLKYHTNVLFYTKYTHPTLICRGRTDARTDGRTDRKIYSIFRDKLLLLGEHVFSNNKNAWFTGPMIIVNMENNHDWLASNKTWKKWARIGDGELLSYAGIDFQKPLDEDQLVKEIKRRKKLNDMKLDNNRKQAAQKRSIEYPNHLKQVKMRRSGKSLPT